MDPWQQLIAALGVGLLWGCTNPITRLGCIRAHRKAAGAGVRGTIAAALATPLLLLPQVSVMLM